MTSASEMIKELFIELIFAAVIIWAAIKVMKHAPVEEEEEDDDVHLGI